MSKPRVFISSTIYDFKDLRSAIKYFLEQNGFEVVTSENVDFPADNRKNSFQACLDAINTCDYFILLIGSRIGCKYKYIKPDGKTEMITITRAEYRKAYELFKLEKIKIINFVRQEIFDVKEDRKGIENVLLSMDIDNVSKKNIKEHESKIVKDAGEIFNFLDEISRNAEMKAVNEGASNEYPTGNWVYQFNSFSDIIAVLNNALSLDRGTSRQIWHENIRREIIRNLTKLTQKNNKHEIVSIFNFGMVDKSKLEDINNCKLTGNDLWRLFYSNTIYMPFVTRLDDNFISDVLKTDIFFDYNQEKKRFLPNIIFELLSKLSDKIRRAKEMYNIIELQRKELSNFFEKFNIPELHDDTVLYDVDGLLFSASLILPYLCQDIYNLSLEYIKFYNDNSYLPTIKETVNNTVFSTYDKTLSEEKVSFNEIDEIFRKQEKQGANK